MAEKDVAANAPVTIKKYANRRLYNTATSSYVTLDHLCQMVKEGVDFAVFDAKTGEDITRSVLTQIIVEEENKGQNLLPIGFLRQLIGLYGDNMQWMVPRYLEYSMQSFHKNQERMRDYFQNTFGGMFPFGQFEEVSKQNWAIMERAMRMFTPFGTGDMGLGLPPHSAVSPAPSATETAAVKARGEAERSLEELQKRLDDLQKQVADLSKAPKSEA